MTHEQSAARRADLQRQFSTLSERHAKAGEHISLNRGARLLRVPLTTLWRALNPGRH